MLRKILVFVFLFALAAASVQADVIIVEDLPGVDTEIQNAVINANTGDTIIVTEGNYRGAKVDKQLEIVGDGAHITSGVSGVVGWPGVFEIGFYFPNDGSGNNSSISHFTIDCDYDPENEKYLVGGVHGKNTDDVTVSHLVINDALEAIYFVTGNKLTITHNKINGAVIGIDLRAGNMYGGESTNKNLVAFNTINESGFGIQLLGYRRDPYRTPVKENKIVHNKVTAEIGILLDDWSDSTDYVRDNLIGFNDFSGCPVPDQIVEGVEGLLDVNIISRNLGDNRSYEPLPDDYGIEDFNPQPPQ